MKAARESLALSRVTFHRTGRRKDHSARARRDPRGARVDDAVDAVAGARVLAGSAAGLSDEKRVFGLDAVPAGPTLVEARHPHYEQFQQAMQIEQDYLDVVFEAGQEIRGRVVDSTGAPVAGAPATLAPERRRGVLSRGAGSGIEGDFVLARVAAGRYRLQASARGYADTELPQAVTVRRDGVQGIGLVLAPGGAVTGCVLGLANDELALVRVRASHEAGMSKLGELDAAGNYALSQLSPGAWLVEASLRAGQRSARARVLLPEGGEETRDLRFGAGLTLAGRVLYRDQPLADAKGSPRGQGVAV